MRVKLARLNPSYYRCCCCDVRTGTILLGLFQLIVQSCFLVVLVLSLVHPDILQRLLTDGQDVNQPVLNSWDQYQDEVTTPETTGIDTQYEDSFFINYHFGSCFTRKWTKDDTYIGIGLVIGAMVVSVFLVYGAAKSRPSLLMPYFALSVFGFALTCLTVVNYMAYMPDVKCYIQVQKFLPDEWKNRLLACDPQLIMIAVISFFVLDLGIQLYLLNMVWKCYKYLNELNLGSAMSQYMDQESEVLLPPKYEEAIREPDAQPPPYSS